MNEVNLVKSINKNPRNFLGISHVQTKPLLDINWKTMHKKNNILNYREVCIRRTISLLQGGNFHRNITRINRVFQVCLT